MDLRCSGNIKVLEEHHGQNLIITGSKLPSFKKVLHCYLAHVDELKKQQPIASRVKYKAAMKVASEVICFYNKARIPAMQIKCITNKIIYFHDKEYQKCLKIPNERRKGNAELLRFQEKLNLTMPFYAKNAESLMKNSMKGKQQYEKDMIQEDLLFLENIKSKRTFSLGGRDKKWPE